MPDSPLTTRWIVAVGLAVTTHMVSATTTAADARQMPEASSEMASYGPRVFHCPITIEDMLPGYYYSCRARYYLQHHKPTVAILKLKEAARWADKQAQYTLGLIYFNGDVDGVPADRALGLAWLGIAAERKNPGYMRTYAAALGRSTPDELARGNRLWQQLNRQYSDKVVGPRAVTRYNRAVRKLQAMSMGSTRGFKVHAFTEEAANSETDNLDRIASLTFSGMQGTVTVGEPDQTDVESTPPTALPARRPAAPAR